MSNDSINRLIVRGPAKDVETFAKTATDPRIVKRQLDRPSNRVRQLGLSFNALLNSLPAGSTTRLDREVTEPWELSVDPPVRLEGGMVERAYRFQLRRYEPDPLLTEVSKQYAHLCFVLGWVDPNSDDQASRFIYSGYSVLYRLPEGRKRLLQVGIPEEGSAAEADILMALAESDWAMMDAVVAHWDRKAASILRRIASSTARIGGRPSCPKKRSS